MVGRPNPRPLKPPTAAVIALVLLTVLTAAQGATQKFFDDDPLWRVPETQDASGAVPFDIELRWDLAYNLFANPARHLPRVRAKDVNTVDEVPDSSWFTNRILWRDVSVDEITRGPLTDAGPAPGPLTVVASKSVGDAPGFVARDARGETWFVTFDARGFPEGATGAMLVANKLFWALGYWQVENYLAAVRPETLVIDENATWRPQSGERRAMRRSDLEQVFRRSHRSADGSYRAVAARALKGKILGGFQYFGTRPDDPNDLVPHEHRRVLRALKVFGAWTNLVDMKAGNTMDVVVPDRGKGVVRHYLQDVGSTFGASANGPRAWDEGWNYLYEGDVLWKRLVTLGFYFQPWQTASYKDYPGVGRVEGDAFEPRAWKPRVPTAAFLLARDDDNFWAARRVLAFSDELIRAAVKTGRFSDPAAERYLADVIVERRDKIARAYLASVNPLVDFALDATGRLTFDNAAVRAGVAAPPRGGYTCRWFRFDNLTARSEEIGVATTMDLGTNAPAGLPVAEGSFVKVQVSALDPPDDSWTLPVDAYFRRTAEGWKLVGFERSADE
jgi:hypothetical protein